MNDPLILTVIGTALAVLAFFLYLRWRRSPGGSSSAALVSGAFRILAGRRTAPGGTAGRPEAFEGYGFLTGKARRPMEEIRVAYAEWILLGAALAVLSLVFRTAITEKSARWIAFPFLALGIAAAVYAAHCSERLERAGLLERIAAFLAHRMRVDIVRLTCLIGSAVYSLLGAAAWLVCGWDAAWTVIVLSAVLAAGLAVGFFRVQNFGPPGSQTEGDISSPDDREADE
ncbi:MAG: hypothetical protein JW929_14755 [Anaerolineales bacterium]|nr:hypothetical protein [Anaerolineales bacterium]